MIFSPALPEGGDWLWVILVGLFYNLANLAYFYALKLEESTRVIPLYSLTNIFLPVLAAVFLGEIFGGRQYLGILLIIVGSFVIMARGSISSVVKNRAMGLMALSALSCSLGYVITKYLLSFYRYETVFGYTRFFTGFLGFFILMKYLKEIIRYFSSLKKRYIYLVTASEILNLGGGILMTISFSFWFVALAEAAASAQYIFLFLWVILFTRFKPSILSEELNRKIMVQKIISIILIIAGIYLVS